MKQSTLQNPSLRNRKGFTLIELIVVVAIIAILAAIAIPSFLNLRADANDKAAIANLVNIQKGAEVAAAKNNIAISAVTTAQIEGVLGITLASMNGSPSGAVYSWTQPYAAVASIAVPGDHGAAFNYSAIS